MFAAALSDAPKGLLNLHVDPDFSEDLTFPDFSRKLMASFSCWFFVCEKGEQKKVLIYSA